MATREDIDYIIQEANRIIDPLISVSDIIGVYAGLRPLVSQKADTSTTKLSREHTVDGPADGFVSVAGGKYTTYRVMAEDVINAGVKELKKNVSESITDKLPLVGADGYSALQKQIPLLAADAGLSEETIRHLLDRYGSLISEVLALIESEPSLGEFLSPELPYLKAEIHYAVSHEGARSVEDVLSRRTRISFEAFDGGVSLAEEVSRIISPVLGWSTKERKQSVSAYEKLALREQAGLASLNS